VGVRIMENIQSIRELIENKINNDLNWANPYWPDEVKEDYPGTNETEINNIYVTAMKNKVDSLSIKEAQDILEEQTAQKSANQNFLLENLLEEKLQLI